MKKQNYERLVAFRASDDQVKKVEEMAIAAGLSTSNVLRQLIDSAALVNRPMIATQFSPGQRMAATSAP